MQTRHNALVVALNSSSRSFYACLSIARSAATRWNRLPFGVHFILSL